MQRCHGTHHTQLLERALCDMQEPASAAASTRSGMCTPSFPPRILHPQDQGRTMRLVNSNVAMTRGAVAAARPVQACQPTCTGSGLKLRICCAASADSSAA